MGTVNNSEMAQLEAEFDSQMFWICDECKRLFDYPPARFQAMVSEMGGLRTAKILLDPKRTQSRTVAWEEFDKSRGSYFYLTMEYLVVQTRYRDLFFDAEINEAEMRLAWFDTERVNRDLYPNPQPPPR
jgi:hypothetical protein